MRHFGAPVPPPITLTLEGAASYLGLSEWKLSDLCRRGIVPHLKLGRRTLFRKAALDETLARLEQASTLPELGLDQVMAAALREGRR